MQKLRKGLQGKGYRQKVHKYSRSYMVWFIIFNLFRSHQFIKKRKLEISIGIIKQNLVSNIHNH